MPGIRNEPKMLCSKILRMLKTLHGSHIFCLLYLTLETKTPFVGRPHVEVPRLITMENIDSNSVLLNNEYAWIISGCLPQHEREEWTLLYHSAFNGLSFTTFLGSSL